VSPRQFTALQAETRRRFEELRSDPAAALRLLDVIDALGRIFAAVTSADWTAAEDGHVAQQALKEVKSACAELEEAVRAARKLLTIDLQRRLGKLADELSSVNNQRFGAHRSTKPAVVPRPRVLPPSRHAKATSPRETEVAVETASFGAGVPRSAAPGSHFPAHFVAYPVDQDEAALAMLGASLPEAATIVAIGSADVSPGTLLQVALSGHGLLIEGAQRQVQLLRWTGRPAMLTFDVEASSRLDGNSTVLRFDVMIEGLQVAWVRLPIGIATTAPSPAGSQSVTVGHGFARRAFASYASVDRQRVLDRVAAIRIATRIEIFVDRAALQPGEMWRNRLATEIDTCDTFMLFWSDASKKSRWVRWEWERALTRPGIEQMQFHPLVNGVRPPRELKAIHLADAMMDLREADAAANRRRPRREKHLE